MKQAKTYRLYLFLFLLALPLLAYFHLISGQVSLQPGDLYKGLFAYDPQSETQLVFRELRLPRMLTAIFAGGALALGGLLMQSLFRNPLAEPYVLGINAGSALFVALTVMSGIPFFLSDGGLIINALVGAFVFGLLILVFARFVRNQVSLLLVGIMLGSFIAAFISILQSISSANELKVFTLWGLGSLQKTQLGQIPLIAGCITVGFLGSFLISKKLNLLVLPDKDAAMLGLKIKPLRYLVIGITALLSGVVTAFCGPIAFVGLAVPNIARLVFKTQQHLILIPASFLMGSLFLLFVDLLIQLLEVRVLIPVNALTAILGAPIVIIIIFKKMR